MIKYLGFLVLITTCQPKNKAFDLTPSYPEEEVKGVFAPWDGHWQGVFYIYSDPIGQKSGNSLPLNIYPDIIEEKTMIKVDSVNVNQEYNSLSPTSQSVRITDVFDCKKVISEGKNEVIDGKLKCIVNKPDEQVIHEGEITPDGYLIWKRYLTNPLKIEYFKEKVIGDQYTIIGWGYYGNDNPSLSPKTWFRATYEKM